MVKIRENSFTTHPEIVTGILKALSDLGIEGATQNCKFSMLLGRNLIVEIMTELGELYTAKRLKIGSKPNEFKLQVDAHKMLPGNVPKPLGVAEFNNTAFIIMETAISRPLSLGVMRDQKSKWNSNLLRLFTNLHHKAVISEQSCHWDTVLQAALILPDDAREILLSSAELYAKRALKRLNHSRQHGDLAINNIGVSARDLFVFDWEDFGEVTMPGFDLAIFIGSCIGHSPKAWKLLNCNQKPQQLYQLRNRVVSQIGLSDRDFVALIPIYYLLFYLLKKNNGYSSSIQNLALSLVKDF